VIGLEGIDMGSLLEGKLSCLAFSCRVDVDVDRSFCGRGYVELKLATL
jgi:hypothetical protein